MLTEFFFIKNKEKENRHDHGNDRQLESGGDAIHINSWVVVFFSFCSGQLLLLL